MKIAVCGKGGSGKSTITALLAQSFIEKGYSVLVIDSDESNLGLFRKLGFERAPLPIIEIAGGRQGIKSRAAKFEVGGKNPKPDILEASTIKIADIPPENIVRRNGMSFIQVGKINEALEGCACPMGVLNREFLGKLKLEKEEIVLVDTEAGLEHFGRGMDTNIDAIIILVDPSYESIDFAEKAYDLSTTLKIKIIRVILNKINARAIADKLIAKLKERSIIPLISVPEDRSIFNSELNGKQIATKSAGKQISLLVENLIKSEVLKDG